MNNEEFTGHLLASLHGPKGPEIAERFGKLTARRLAGAAGIQKVATRRQSTAAMKLWLAKQQARCAPAEDGAD